ncbi:MAG: ABC transporter ATP-binding protein [Pseudomonadota bacterium]|nr:ABC transporter ATP-binding protein [Pseudomonadota bacterium]HJO36406.1 ABC transporter ATP-binding protein [Gammaproteobacteria bacterium]
MSLLEVDRLQVGFAAEAGEVLAVRELSYALAPGETLGIVGESGSGKSQSVLALMGLLPDNARVAGSALFQGEQLLGAPEGRLQNLRGNHIGMVFQDPMTALNPYLRVERQLAEVLMQHRGAGWRQARHQAIEMLEAVRIPDAARRARQYPHEFSGGMRQRVMIAMALLCQPQLLICDEPTTALDVTVQAQILALLKSLQHDFGTAIIFISHDLGVVAGLCDRVLVMYAGELAEQAETDALFAAPQHPYTRGLLHALPRLDAAGERLATIPGAPPSPQARPPGCPFHPRCAYRFAPCDTQNPPPSTVGPNHIKRCHLRGFDDAAA